MLTTTRTRRLVALAAGGILAATALGACGGDDSGTDTTPATEPAATEAPTTVATEPPTTPAPVTTPPTTEAPVEPLTVLVTNDDGVGAPGIDAIVEALTALPDVEVIVVAPLENQSGSGGKTTDGPLTSTEATTASGYPAIAVTGFPADSIIWALDQGGIDLVPDLVISGINEGQNFGPLVDVSGTVGAARAAARRGIPAVAASQGAVPDPAEPDYESGVEAVLAWLESAIDSLRDGTYTVDAVVGINIPSCADGTEIRGTVEVPVATGFPDGVDIINGVDCSSTLADPADDVLAMLNGFISVSPVPIEPAPTG